MCMLIQASAEARDMALGLYERDPVHPLNPDMVCGLSNQSMYRRRDLINHCSFGNLCAEKDSGVNWQVQNKRGCATRNCTHLQCAAQELLHCCQGIPVMTTASVEVLATKRAFCSFQMANSVDDHSECF